MEYEVIRDIKNQCKNNSMRDIFFEEIETDDPDKWIRQQEPYADSYEREDIPGGIRYTVRAKGIPTIYSLTEI